MKSLIVYILSFLIFLPAFSQDFGEKWIVNGQRYYKIKTAEDGLYRITYQNLVDAGFPVNTAGFNKRKIQIFHRGVEQAIFIPGSIDGAMSSSEYVEFFGKKNDGILDASLYKQPEYQPHGYYNLHSDTTAFFLTYAFGTVNGKRMEVRSAEFNSGGLPKETYHLDEKLLVFTTQYSEGQYYPLGSNSITLLADFDTGEGWTGNRIQKPNSAPFTISDITNVVPSGPKPALEVLLVGRNNRKHNITLSAGSSTASLRTIKDLQFDYYAKALIAENLEPSDISAQGKVELRVKVNGFADPNTDHVSVSYIKLKYPQSFAMSGSSKLFNVAPNPTGKSFVEITNVGATTVLYDVTDLNNIKRLNYFISGTTLNTVVSGTQSGVKLLAVSNEYKLIEKLTPVTFRNLSADANYLIVSHSILRQPFGNLSDPVKAYGEYRASAQGGGFDTLIMNVNQLYDQFTYGEVNPLAIRRFAAYMLNYGDPKYLLLIGKGTNVTLKYFRSVWDESNIHRNLIPPIGFPGSDILYTSGLKGTTHEPAIPTGRITARTPEEVYNYLTKIMEMEGQNPDELWPKKLIHLSGGLQSSEVELFKSYVKNFEDVAEGKYLGGEVTTISKTTTLNVEFINIADQVNNGSSLVTFFGHSAPDVTDIDIGKCSDDINGYNNKGKYPMFYINGCDAGDIYGAKYSLGEDWMVKRPDRGAIAFYAFSHLAYAGPLKRMADIFYSTAFGDSTFINKSIGEVNQELVRRFLSTYTNTELYISQANQMVLQGDPAYKLFKPTTPDFSISENSLYIHSYDEKPVTALTDSFAIAVIVKNIGRVSSDSIEIRLRRLLETGDEITIDTIVPPIFYQDTIFINVKATDQIGFGENKFEVTIDPSNKITEVDKLNNTATLEHFIPLTKVAIVVPNEFAIINTDEVTLIAQNTEIIKSPVQYLFEIDTSFRFNSGWKKQQVITSQIPPKWKVNVSQVKDTTVFFWRVKLNNNDPSNVWASSSFTYIKNGPEGWAQSSFPQFAKNGSTNIIQNINTRRVDFEDVLTKLSVKTYGDNYATDGYKFSEMFLNEFPHVYEGRCADDRLIAVAFNKVTAEPYLIYNKINYGSGFYCGRTFNEIANRMTDAQIGGASLLLEDYINRVPDGDFVLFFSTGLVKYESWPATTKAKLEELGIDLTTFNKLKNGYPYIVFGQKGGTIGSAIQVLPNLGPMDDPLTQSISFNYSVAGKRDRGSMTSTRIGPSAAWKTLHTKSFRNSQDDVVTYDVIGLDINNNEHVLASSITDTNFDLNFIDPTLYPSIKVRTNLKDSVLLTSPQLRRWQVDFEGVPEGIVYTAPNQKLDSIKVEEGEQVAINFVFANVSNKNFTDSVVVQQTVVNNNTMSKEIIQTKYKPIAIHDSISFSSKINTSGKIGVNTLQTYVNPRIQPEQNYANNIISLNKFLTVDKDKTNPILDVVFDGVHIMDGDLVSPSPLINITLKDESKFKFKKDTVGLEVYIKNPCEGCTYQRISFSDPNIKWTPANEENNKFQIEYQPKQLSNGRYSLLVQGTDESGNKSGVAPYEVSFEVINESTISNFYPYPNPFSTKTRFVFRLTGRELPDEIKVIIMTISGKVVREIDQNELGPIKIGDNKTEFFWDGTDQFGDKLANGVYLYKVSVKKNGILLDHRDTKGDKGFHKGFGKMYILR